MLLKPSLKQEGFSLLELMVSLATVMMILFTVVSFTITHQRSIANSMRYIQGVRELRAIMKIVTLDMQRAGLNLDSTERLALADAQTMQLSMDVNKDSTIETVTYSLDTGEPTNKKFLRNGQVLTEHLDALSFYYFNMAGTTLSALPLNAANRSQVRSIKIALTAKPPTVSGREKSVNMSTRVLLRN